MTSRGLCSCSAKIIFITHMGFFQLFIEHWQEARSALLLSGPTNRHLCLQSQLYFAAHSKGKAHSPKCCSLQSKGLGNFSSSSAHLSPQNNQGHLSSDTQTRFRASNARARGGRGQLCTSVWSRQLQTKESSQFLMISAIDYPLFPAALWPQT